MTLKTGAGASTTPDATQTATQTCSTTSVVPTADEIGDWLAQQAADRRRRRELAAELRLQFAIARSAGLRRRHAAKLSRGGGRR